MKLLPSAAAAKISLVSAIFEYPTFYCHCLGFALVKGGFENFFIICQRKILRVVAPSRSFTPWRKNLSEKYLKFINIYVSNWGVPQPHTKFKSGTATTMASILAKFVRA